MNSDTRDVPPRLLAPLPNPLSGPVTLPFQESGTLSKPVLEWLHTQGIDYLIPSMPELPPVTSLTAARVAAKHTPVGPHPRIRELALISPLTVLPPLIAHFIYWVVVLSPARRPSYHYYVTFVEVEVPNVVGSLRRLPPPVRKPLDMLT